MSEHVPVLLSEVLGAFSTYEKKPEMLLDGTFGRGGHTREILKAFPGIKAIGLDRDHEALEFGATTFSEEIKNGLLRLERTSFSQYAQKLEPRPQFDFILLDLGVSSPQLDQAHRGFSFYHDGPLDMRMDQNQKTTAAEVINEWDEEQLVEIFKNYGEIRSPFRVVRAIVHDRKEKPFETTRQLAGLIERVDGWRQKGKNPATQYFMALRLLVNQELEQVRESIPNFIRSLVPGGILVVITFHSLEDRIVKTLFKENEEWGRKINKKVIVASREEEKENPRSRSAKLRAFRRSDNDEENH
ncbi:MAG: 16S rRNA (cytosine(1402)-N(4))-methyltransferase RsmH [Bdellovibrionales bacterium]|nr:16S rRNA (cytosine(1402)-N(4))-methyltransferase RsmH [Bdellovibrionales bacterium]